MGNVPKSEEEDHTELTAGSKAVDCVLAAQLHGNEIASLRAHPVRQTTRDHNTLRYRHFEIPGLRAGLQK
jgi:hypothetical protein